MPQRLSRASAQRAVAALGVVALVALAGPPVLAQDAGFTIAEPRAVPPAGLTVEAQRTRYWAVAPGGGRLTAYALDASGQPLGSVDSFDYAQSLQAVAFRAPYLYLGDVGGVRRIVTIWRMEGPVPGTSIHRARAFRLRYPDGSHNAGTVLVDLDRRLYVVTKGSSGGIYRAPERPSDEETTELERVGDAPDDITDGVVLFDGRIVLRSATRVYTLDPDSYDVVADAKLSGQPEGLALAQSTDGDRVLAGSDAAGEVVALDVPGPAPATAAPVPTVVVRTPPPAGGDGDTSAIEQTGTTTALIAAAAVAALAGLVVAVRR